MNVSSNTLEISLREFPEGVKARMEYFFMAQIVIEAGKLFVSSIDSFKT